MTVSRTVSLTSTLTIRNHSAICILTPENVQIQLIMKCQNHLDHTLCDAGNTISAAERFGWLLLCLHFKWLMNVFSHPYTFMKL